MNDVGQSPPKKYSYEDWAWFLKLMGEDEGDATTHRAAKVQAGDDNGKTNTGIDRDQGTQGSDSARSGSSRTVEEQGDVDERGKWSWLGARSPLMVGSDEADWVLERLSATLEKELKEQRDLARRGSKGNGELEGRAMGAIKRTGETQGRRTREEGDGSGRDR